MLHPSWCSPRCSIPSSQRDCSHLAISPTSHHMIRPVRHVLMRATNEEPGSPPTIQAKPSFDPAQTVVWGGSLPSARRVFLGSLTGLGVALGGNLGGVTSWLLSLDGGAVADKTGLDLILPVNMATPYKRCKDEVLGFEFVYPAAWLGDQTLAKRAAQRAEEARGLSPWGDLSAARSNRPPRDRPQVVEPVAAFGPAGSTGEVNVSVVVAPILEGFSLEALGSAEEVARQFLRTISPEGSGRVTQLFNWASQRSTTPDAGEDPTTYYSMEYTVKGPSSAAAGFFFRHNLSVITSRGTQLFTLNAQCPENDWAKQAALLHLSADSFQLTR